MTPRVSIVTAFLNADAFLPEAVDSVLAQECCEWELLLVDDGSTDDSSRMARDLAAAHPGQIHYLEHDDHANRGTSASRNLGVRYAVGEWIAFLDADDVWFPHKLREQLALASSHPLVGMICGATEYWSSWNGAADDRWLTVGGPLNIVIAPPTLSIVLYPLGKGAAPCVSDVLVRRDLIKQVGGFEEHFRGDLQLYEDQAFFSKIYLTAAVFLTSARWDRYRQHADSCVATVGSAGKYQSVREYSLPPPPRAPSAPSGTGHSPAPPAAVLTGTPR